jgi:hypothetical protein
MGMGTCTSSSEDGGAFLVGRMALAVPEANCFLVGLSFAFVAPFAALPVGFFLALVVVVRRGICEK